MAAVSSFSQKAFKFMLLFMSTFARSVTYRASLSLVISFHLVMILIQAFVMVKSFNAPFLMKYGPTFFITTYNLGCAANIVISAPEFTKILDVIPQGFTVRKKFADKIESDCRLVVILTAFSICTTSAGILLLSPISNQEMFYAIAFFETHFPKYSDVFYWIYTAGLSTLIFVTGGLPLGQLLYLFKIKFFLLKIEDEIESLSDGIESSDDCILLRDQWYQKRVKDKLRQCIEQHLIIARAYIKLTHTVRFPLLLLSTIGLIAVADVLYCISTDQAIVLSYSLLISSVIFATLFAFSGQELINESERLYDKLVRVPWTSWNVENRKNLVMFLMNTSEPMSIACTGKIRCNFELFVELFKMAFSFSTIISKTSKQQPS